LTSVGLDSGTYASDPYDKFEAYLSSGHPNHHFVLLDRLSAILSSIQMVREKITSLTNFINDASEAPVLCVQLSNRLELLDAIALEKATTLMKSIKQATIAVVGIAQEFKSASEASKVKLLRDCRGHFARSLDLYRTSPSNVNAHKICAQWADLLLRTMTLLSESGHNGQVVDYLHTQHSGTSDGLIAEVMAVKALSLARSGDVGEGLSCARSAWQKACTTSHPATYNLAVLFHCALLSSASHLSSGQDYSRRLATSDFLLLELDDAFSHVSKRCRNDEFLDVFPTLSNSCVEVGREENDVVLLAVQEKWIKVIVGSESLLCALQHQQNEGAAKGNTTKASANPP